MPIHGNWSTMGLDPATFPEIAGTYSGRCVIVGSAPCVWRDWMHVDPSVECDVMAVNDMIAYFPGTIEHAYSNDHVMLPNWVASRRPQYVQRAGVPRHFHTCHHGAQWSWPWPGSGTSGLGAVLTALALGYDEVWLCGIPLDDSGFFFAPEWVNSTYGRSKDRDDPERIPYWTSAARSVFEGRVKSFSGRTRDLLGEPA